MIDPILIRRKDTLSAEEAFYWKDLFYRTIKIGTELEAAPPKGVSDTAEFINKVEKALSPSGSMELLGSNGVFDIVKEHCGIEIRVIGRQPHFRVLQKQYQQIMETLSSLQARIRPTCGLHFHVLTPGLAEPVPEIILANLWNVTRRYAPELRFITSCGDSRDALCRRRNHTSHLEMVRHSPINFSMAEIHQKLKESLIVQEHQNFLNLEHLAFNPDGSILPFHLEFRFPDADLSATSVTAKTFLFFAMILKAVDLSQYGVIHVGKIKPWRRKTELLDWISNNDGSLATSDTSRISDEVLEELRNGGRELLDLLSPTFEWFHDSTLSFTNPALEVLNSLAEQPISLLRCAGYNWQEIETYLNNKINHNRTTAEGLDQRLMQRIELGEWTNLPSKEAWQWHAARELFLTPQELEGKLAHLHTVRGLRWEPKRGTLVFTS